MIALLARFSARHSRPIYWGTLLFGVLCMLAMGLAAPESRLQKWLGAFGAWPVGLVIALLLLPRILGPDLSRRRRRAWTLILLAQVLDLVASLGWGYQVLHDDVSIGAWPDVLYVFFYPLVAIACVLLYADIGGGQRSLRSLIDLTTLTIGLCLLLWFTTLAPLGGMNAAQLAEHWSVIGYALGNVVALVCGGLLAMQIANWRAERSTVWLLVGLVVTLVADLTWVNAELRGNYELGGASDQVYQVYYLCLLTAAHTLDGRATAESENQMVQGDLRGSLPIVALMVGTIALLYAELGLGSGQVPLLVGVLVSATLLVIAGQAFATREVVGLHREVATRRFDERLTELVRRSSDMIAICAPDGALRYASPSAEQLLGVPPAQLAGRRLDDVLGPEAPNVRAVFDKVVAVPHAEQIATFSIPQADGEKRSYKMVIANLCHVESIRGVTLNIRDISDATRLNDQLRTLAFHDPLTLLANRSLFSERVHQAIKHIDNGMTPAVLFIDLDNFKTVNDSLGHGAGDQLLRAFAHRLVQCTRAGDTVARLGGDEFAVLIDHAPNPEAAMAVGRQVLNACRQPFDIDGRPLRIGASIGVAMSDRVSTVERLMRNADAAMYAAKSQGKNQAAVFQPEMLRAARRRMRIENELDQAIEQGQLEALYQPIVDMGSRHLIGVEALMRWRHPTRGMVLPAEFIGLAEETGQIVRMTQWMLDRACADAARLQREVVHGEGLRIAVNVSSRYLNSDRVVEEVRGALARHGLRPESLILEVTESLLLENSPQLERTFAELKALGVRLALDDFGTGYSSLAYLHRFPIDILKIDRSFVDRLARDPSSSEGADAVALARAILSMAAALGLDTVAEGIEYDAQRETLLDLGCRTGQGFSFGKPMSIHEVLEAAVTRRRNLLGDNLTAQTDYTATGRFRGIAEKS